MFKTTKDPDLAGNPIDDVIGSSIKYAALTAAGKLGMFRELRGKSLPLSRLAEAIGASEQGIQVLADVLVTLGYLRCVDGRYENGPVARRWLGEEGPLDFTPALLWAYELQNVLWELPQAIQQGKPSQSLWERWADRPEAGKDFSDYMKVKSMLTVSAIVDAVEIPQGATRLLDLGGSHGLHSIAFCRRHPELTATIFDLPEALLKTGDALEESGLSNRITIQHGNFLEDELGTGYDVVLLFEILHNHTPEENTMLLTKAANALRPSGVVVILDDVRGEEFDEHNVAFSLAMFACSGDRTYSLNEIDHWLERAGFDSSKQLALPSSVSLVVATRTD